jgi:lipoprotein-anchoring transpeptidase ErfK/SrfK
MMRIRPVEVAATALALCFTLHAPMAAEAQKKKAPGQSRAAAAKRGVPPKKGVVAKLPCGDLVGFQVLLDRQGFSPGQIDGKPGDNFTRALAAFQAARKLPAGRPDCATWEALGATGGEPTIKSYTITETDVKGPFEKTIPPRLVDQAKLGSLGYKSPLEQIAERFHASPALLAQLNPGLAIVAGREIKVPAVTPFNSDTKPAPDAAAGDIRLQVSKDESALRATRADGTLVFFAPVSSGSVHDPLPTGDYKVLGVGWRPVFNYNPDLFWDAKASDEKAAIKPGPNNPVGVVWISLSLEHYGIHGTPEPGNIGHTESHGCVRLTNWDAARVASLVKPGTPVMFR